MGLSDRDYNRVDSYDEGSSHSQKGAWTVTTIIIVINIVLWLANGLFYPVGNDLTEKILFAERYIRDPLEWYRFLTYGFAHSPHDWTHIGFNMLNLLMFGYGMMLGFGPGGFGLVRSENVETRLGKLEFAVFYLLTILIGGIVFATINVGNSRAAALGASGGVCGVVILYAWMFPRKTLLLYGFLPLPMWGLGLLMVFMDASGSLGVGSQGIAYSIHLAGAAFATLYYFLFVKNGIKMTGWLRGWKRLKRKPKLRIYPQKENTDAGEKEFNRKLDDILDRYSKVGEAGLTKEERDFLQKASRKFAKKYRGNR